MAIADSYGLFWNSDSGDRKYNAESFEKWLRKFFTSGVFEGDLQVVQSSGMTIAVRPGYCNLFGKVGLFETSNNITLSAPNSIYPRIDTIVVERNDTDREISLKAITGAYSGNTPQPTPPVWSETDGIYQLVLAQIYVSAGASAITQADITDTRENPEICGYITGTVEEIDFSQITAQFEAYYAQFVAGNEADFEAWFQEMKDQLSEDAAGHLQAEIDTINGNIDTINGNIDNISNTLGNISDASDVTGSDAFKKIHTLNTSKGAAPKILTQTLAAGVTSLTFTDASIGNNSRIRPFSKPFVSNLIKNMVQSGTSVTITCQAQNASVSVLLEVYN